MQMIDSEIAKFENPESRLDQLLRVTRARAAA